MILSAVRRAIARHRLARPGERVLVACSGGPDSMALLDALVRLRGEIGVEVVAATVDHGLRPEARAEAEGVRAFCAARGVPCHVLRVKVRGRSQDSARRARHAALARSARRAGCARIALGHTRTDQAETVLMRIVRGAGLRGLGAMAPRSGALVRPLLAVPRGEIERYVARRALPVARDPSNLDPRYLRVRLRRDLLPLLARENPRIEEALAALADAARAAAGDLVLPPLSRAHLHAIAELVSERRGTRSLDLPGGLRAHLRVEPRAAGPPSRARAAPAPAAEVAIARPGRRRVPGTGATLVVERARGAGPAAARPGEAWIDPAAAPFPLTARTRRPGDRIRLRGGTRKVSDALIDARVPRETRARLLLLCHRDGRVLWIEGVAQAAGSEPRGPVALRVRVERRVERPGV